jgi:hypothetical protein
MENVTRFDFNGTPKSFKRTPQGFLRVQACLSKTGIFDYQNQREYRPDVEVFRADALASLQGAPVTDLHPSEKGADSFLTPGNTRQHIIGMTESVKQDGPYLKGTLVIFHEDAIKAIESGERQEISLGYQCRLDPTPGTFNGEAYDAVQKDIVINHVAIGPKGWGRAGADCSIRTDSHKPPLTEGISKLSETVRLDGVDVLLAPESITAHFEQRKRQYSELMGRLDAMEQELVQEKQARAELENPKAIEGKVQSRLKLIERCRSLLGSDFNFEEKTDEELKIAVIKSFNPDIDISDKDQSYLDGMFETLLAVKSRRNDSLADARKAINHIDSQSKVHEYGSQDGRIPARSFIRSTCDAMRTKHLKLMSTLQNKILGGKLLLSQALDTLGEVISKDMVSTINQGVRPDLTEGTIKRKKSSKPLIDTGRLKGAITHEVRQGTNDEL